MVDLKEYIEHPELLDVMDIDRLAKDMKNNPASTRARWMWLMKKRRMEGKPLKDLRLAWMHAPEMTTFHQAFHSGNIGDIVLELESGKESEKVHSERYESPPDIPESGESQDTEMKHESDQVQNQPESPDEPSGKRQRQEDRHDSPPSLEEFKIADDIHHSVPSPESASSESDFLNWLKGKEHSSPPPQEENETSKTSPAKGDTTEKRAQKEEESSDSKSSPVTDEQKKAMEAAIRKSIEEDEDILSPTLAQVLARQGHINRAIDMYEKLRLVYPEKSAYFAEKIKQLKNR